MGEGGAVRAVLPGRAGFGAAMLQRGMDRPARACDICPPKAAGSAGAAGTGTERGRGGMVDLVPLAREPVSLADLGEDSVRQWEQVSLLYRSPLRGFFSKRVNDPAEVEDLIQEVFLHLVRRAQGGPIEHVKQYVFQIAANALRDWGRRRVVRNQHAHESFDEQVHQPATDISPERVLLGEEAIALVTATLNALPERTRDVFVLRVLEKQKYAEIAAALGISVRAAEKHMARALAQLGRAMDDGEGLD
jgi:RNA polymerase sigma factor (sigma-70 family)